MKERLKKLGRWLAKVVLGKVAEEILEKAKKNG